MPMTTSLRRRPAYVAATVALALLAGLPGLPGRAQDGPQPDGGPLKAQYDEVLGQEARLQAAVEASARRRAELYRELGDLDRQVVQATSQLRRAETDLATAIGADRKARAELAVARRRLARAIDELHAQAVSSYINGDATDDELSAAVRALDDGSVAARSLTYADAVNDHQRAVVREFNAARADRDRKATAATAARARATQARDSIAAAKAQLESARARTVELGAELAREQYLQQANLTELRGRKLEIEARIVSLEKASDGLAYFLASLQGAEPAFLPGAVVVTSPIPGAAVGSQFGMRFHPILHYTRLHAGVDIGVATGTPIRAAADGVVVIAGVRGGYGNCTVIAHGSRLATVYAHQSVIDARVGQQVKAGDVIGRVGSTGLSTGPHLHFETRLAGIPVDPKNFLPVG